jgi:hypothetical protein
MTRRNSRGWAVAATLALSALVAASASDRASAWSSTPPKRGMGATAPNVVEPIVKRMKAAQSRLNEGDTGSQTRGIQEEVVRDLDKLIEAASQQSDSSRASRQSSSGGKSQRETENGSPQQEQGAKRGGAEGASGTASGSAPGSRGGRRSPRAVQTKGAIGRQSTLVREVWGHLPPAVRERVRVDFSETVLPAYDELVRKYFEALLEEPSPHAGRGPSATTAPPANK